jgi:glycine cleavage system H protein
MFSAAPERNEDQTTMTNIPPHIKYTESDEWFDPSSGKAGLTDYAQSQLSDIVFVEVVVSPGDKVGKGTAIASVESVKAAAEVYSPVAGTVAAVNADLSATPEVLNSDPYGSGWMIQIEGADGSALMDSGAYEKHCESRDH